MAEGYAKDRWRNNRTLRIAALLGPILAFLVAMSLIGSGLYLTMTNRDVQGIGIIAGTIAAIVWAFRRQTQHPGSN
jgi:hypothetical protein